MRKGNRRIIFIVVREVTSQHVKWTGVLQHYMRERKPQKEEVRVSQGMKKADKVGMIMLWLQLSDVTLNVSST